MLIEPWE